MTKNDLDNMTIDEVFKKYISLATDFSALLKKENKILLTKNYMKAKEYLPQKASLNKEIDLVEKRIIEMKDVHDQAKPSLLEKVKRISNDMQDLVIENVAALRICSKVLGDISKVVKKSLTEQSAQQFGYNNKGMLASKIELEKRAQFLSLSENA